MSRKPPRHRVCAATAALQRPDVRAAHEARIHAIAMRLTGTPPAPSAAELRNGWREKPVVSDQHEEYPSAIAAARAFGKSDKAVSTAINTGTRCAGRTWSYVTKERGMTEHDLIDAERLAEWRMDRLDADVDDAILKRWIETREMVDKMQSAIGKLVRHVRSLTGERAIRMARALPDGEKL